MKKETFDFTRFGKLKDFLKIEIFGLGDDLKFPPEDIHFDNIYEGDLLYYLKKSFFLLNHNNHYSYIGKYCGFTGWLMVEKIKNKKGRLIIIIDTLSKDIEFKIK